MIDNYSGVCMLVGWLMGLLFGFTYGINGHWIFLWGYLIIMSFVVMALILAELYLLIIRRRKSWHL